jgi:hypothetical protein
MHTATTFEPKIDSPNDEWLDPDIEKSWFSDKFISYLVLDQSPTVPSPHALIVSAALAFWGTFGESEVHARMKQKTNTAKWRP